MIFARAPEGLWDATRVRRYQRLLLLWDTRKSDELPAALLEYTQQRLGGNLTLIGTPIMIEAPYRFSDKARVRLAWQLMAVETPQ